MTNLHDIKSQRHIVQFKRRTCIACCKLQFYRKVTENIINFHWKAFRIHSLTDNIAKYLTRVTDFPPLDYHCFFVVSIILRNLFSMNDWKNFLIFWDANVYHFFSAIVIWNVFCLEVLSRRAHMYLKAQQSYIICSIICIKCLQRVKFYILLWNKLWVRWSKLPTMKSPRLLFEAMCSICRIWYVGYRKCTTG